jgi:hypothetical protein
MKGRADRFELFGLAQPDIIQYFSPREFGLDGDRWKPFGEEWRRSRREGGSDDFKAWLRNTKGATIRSSRLKELVEESDRIPEDIARLGSRLVALSGLQPE